MNSFKQDSIKVQFIQNNIQFKFIYDQRGNSLQYLLASNLLNAIPEGKKS